MSDTPAISTPALIIAMIDSGVGISDLLFSPGRPPQVERSGELVPIDIPGLPCLKPDDTKRIAGDLEGMQTFDGELEKMVRAGTITFSSALLYATNPGNLRVQMFDLVEDEPATA